MRVRETGAFLREIGARSGERGFGPLALGGVEASRLGIDRRTGCCGDGRSLVTARQRDQPLRSGRYAVGARRRARLGSRRRANRRARLQRRRVERKARVLGHEGGELLLGLLQLFVGAFLLGSQEVARAFGLFLADPGVLLDHELAESLGDRLDFARRSTFVGNRECVASRRPKLDVFLHFVDGFERAVLFTKVRVQVELFDHALQYLARGEDFLHAHRRAARLRRRVAPFADPHRLGVDDHRFGPITRWPEPQDGSGGDDAEHQHHEDRFVVTQRATSEANRALQLLPAGSYEASFRAEGADGKRHQREAKPKGDDRDAGVSPRAQAR